MQNFSDKISQTWRTLRPAYLPFADAVTPELPLGRLMRLSLFQVTVGMAVVLITGTLNRVMIVELGVFAWLVSSMVALPLILAPMRALIGFRSDVHRSYIGWKRVPYIWFGSLLQFGGFAIMPFALLVLSDAANGPVWAGQVGAALAFLLVGFGIHMTQTAGLALATDLADEKSRPQVVALLYTMLLVGMVVSALVFGYLLNDFSQIKLIQVIQGAAVLTMVLNIIALWKQETIDPSQTLPTKPRPEFLSAWKEFRRVGRATRMLVSVGLGTAAFTMQDILLEPYGGEILDMSVAATTMLTALLAAGTLLGLVIAACALTNGSDPYRFAAFGVMIGIIAFSLVILAGTFGSKFIFCCGTILIGLGAGLFAVGTLTAVMDYAKDGFGGLALGAWGAVQATATGCAIALGGSIRDGVTAISSNGALGTTFQDPVFGYSVVYHFEILLCFATLVAIGPLVRYGHQRTKAETEKFGLAEFPG